MNSFSLDASCRGDILSALQHDIIHKKRKKKKQNIKKDEVDKPSNSEKQPTVPIHLRRKSTYEYVRGYLEK